MGPFSEAPFLQFDFHDAKGNLARQIFKNPVKIIEARNLEEVRLALREVHQATNSGLYAAGFLSYEAAPAFDPSFHVQGGGKLPLVWFGLFEKPVTASVPSPGSFQVSKWKPSLDQRTYRSQIATIQKAIAEGDTSQVNFTMRLTADFEGDDFALYQRMCSAQHAPYSAYLHLGRFRILSASPELFFHLEDGGLTTRPMKGTVKRGRWNEEDEALGQWLFLSEKNRAENAMIVDLLRNDLGTIAHYGSVQVPSLFDIERYQTVMQMTSTVTAELRPDTDLEDIFEALYPCGSITGAPKVSTMKLLASLEETPREVYCGSIGWVAPDGTALFNVAIRTVLIDTETRQAIYGTGGGITWDSDPCDEYAEAMSKADLLTKAWPDFQLLETMRVEKGTYRYLEKHLKRLQESAHYFDIPVCMSKVRELLEKEKYRFSGNDPWKVRLLVSQKGEPRLEGKPLDSELPAKIRGVRIATQPVSKKHRFLYHKTTYRQIYDKQKENHPDAFDVLMWNEEGELTEFTLGNLVVEWKGKRWTPKKECGLLPGTFREELLERGMISECVLKLEDLKKFTRIWLINSVREWVPVELEE